MLGRRSFLKLAATGICMPLALGSYAFAIEPLYRLNTTHYRPQITDWPSGLNLKIAVIADLHACNPWMSVDRIRNIVAQTNELSPDITLLLGDYTSSMNLVTDRVHSSEWAPLLGELTAPLGVHAVLGNHDWWEDREAQRKGHGPTFVHRALERAGIEVLENNALLINKDKHEFWIAGLGDQLAFPPSRRHNRFEWGSMADLDGLMKEISGDAPAILMAHEPDIFPQVPDRISLTISGHTHGGQVRILGYSPIKTSGSRYNYGHVIEGRRNLIVSGGLGCSILPVRFGSPPEIVVIEPRSVEMS